MTGSDRASEELWREESELYGTGASSTKLYRVRKPVEHHCKDVDHLWYKGRGLRCPHCETVVSARVLSRDEINKEIE